MNIVFEIKELKRKVEKLYCISTGIGTESDPTVAQYIKNLTEQDIYNWNEKRLKTPEEDTDNPDIVNIPVYNESRAYWLPANKLGKIISIREGSNIKIDDTDPQNPIISSEKGEEPVTSEFTVTAPAGSFKAGETFPEGLTLSQAFIALLTDVFEPTFVAPSYSLSNNAGSREVGEVITLVLTSTFNRGIIKGAMVDGAWDAEATQNPRAGLPSKHTFDDIAVYITTSLTQSKTISNYTVAASNTFSSSVDYTQGVQPKNSENEDYGTPLTAGSLADTTSFNGGLRRFAGGVTKVPTTGTEVRIALLNTSVINTSNSFSFTTGTTNKTFVIAIPSSKTLTGVKNEGTNENLLSSFVLSEITVVPDAGNTDRPYKVYIMDNAVAFSSNYTISITLA